MISIFAMMPVGALSPDGMYTSGDATVEPSTDQSNSGDYSFKHVATGVADEASIYFDYGDTLESITSVSYYSYVESGMSGELHPYVYLTVDTSDDGVDFWVVQYETAAVSPSGEDTWIQTTFDDSTRIHVPGLTGFGQGDTSTLGDLKAVSGWSTYTVLEVFVELGQFTGASTITAYVDDVTINDLLYDFEPTLPTSTKREALKAKGVPGEGIDEALGLDKAPPNDNFAARERKAHAYGHHKKG